MVMTTLGRFAVFLSLPPEIPPMIQWCGEQESSKKDCVHHICRFLHWHGHSMGVCFLRCPDSPGLDGLAKYRLPQVRSEFLFELLDRIGPLNRFGRLVVV